MIWIKVVELITESLVVTTVQRTEMGLDYARGGGIKRKVTFHQYFQHEIVK